MLLTSWWEIDRFLLDAFISFLTRYLIGRILQPGQICFSLEGIYLNAVTAILSLVLVILIVLIIIGFVIRKKVLVLRMRLQRTILLILSMMSDFESETPHFSQISLGYLCIRYLSSIRDFRSCLMAYRVEPGIIECE